MPWAAAAHRLPRLMDLDSGKAESEGQGKSEGREGEGGEKGEEKEKEKKV